MCGVAWWDVMWGVIEVVGIIGGAIAAHVFLGMIGL